MKNLLKGFFVVLCIACTPMVNGYVDSTDNVCTIENPEKCS